MPEHAAAWPVIWDVRPSRKIEVFGPVGTIMRIGGHEYRIVHIGPYRDGDALRRVRRAHGCLGRPWPHGVLAALPAACPERCAGSAPDIHVMKARARLRRQ
jgi:hypothetical protein